jgi:hypothetical protein
MYLNKGIKMKTTSTGHKINQEQGPRTGNEGTPSKRKEFMESKSKTGSEKASLAGMVTKALESRGRGQAGKVNPALESLHDKTNVGRGPRRGNGGRAGALGATSGY